MNCSTCERVRLSKGQPIVLAHPEEVPWLCQQHLQELKVWHNEQVSKGFIQPWVGLAH